MTENANLKAFQEHQCRETVCLAWLKELQKNVRQPVNTAAIAGIANGLGMMAQAAVLAFIMQSVIIEKAKLGQLFIPFLVLLGITIRDNILLGNPQASAVQLANAIDAAGLTDFIGQLPDGLQTWVGENGLKISGGEASRIALARVYLKNTPILLLDEPTEGLDDETEADVFAALKEMTENRTVVMVTHRSAGLVSG